MAQLHCTRAALLKLVILSWARGGGDGKEGRRPGRKVRAGRGRQLFKVGQKLKLRGRGRGGETGTVGAEWGGLCPQPSTHICNIVYMLQEIQD